MGIRLYVGNLPYTVSENDLEELFSQAGAVKSVEIAKSKGTGRSKGFAFVEMTTDDDARNALQQFNLKPHAGRYLNVNAVQASIWDEK